VGAEEIEFDQWWAEFLVEADGHRDPYLSIEDLRRYISGLSHERRQSFERCLVSLASDRRAGAGLALAALEHAALPETHEALVPLARQSSGASAGLREAALRALAHSDHPQGAALLERYLLHEAIGSTWSAVPWSLWPQAATLFCRAWSRYFSEKPPEVWRGTAIVQAFLKEPRAVRLLRVVLQAENAFAWGQLQAALLQASGASWLTEAERGAVVSELGT
jgi:hypothetical protein